MNLQRTIQSAFQTTFRLTETIAPPLAHRWAVSLFTQPLKFKRPERETALIQHATIARCPYTPFYPRAAADSYYTTYRWGHGPTVLLVHGWAGRGSQMATFAAPLVAAGYGVVTFDAPAHGDSPGKRTNLVEVSNIIGELSAAQGGFAAMIGHSFGGMAAGYALSQGAQADKLITIGSPATIAFVLSDFAAQIHGSPRIAQAVARYIERVTNRPADSFSLTHTLAGSRQPGLIVHDTEDRDVPHEQAHLIHAAWPGSILHTTTGLGHRRILRDAATIEQVVAFLGE